MNILVLAPHSFYIDRGTPIDVDILVKALSNRGDSVDLVVYKEGEDRNYPKLTIHRPNTPDSLKGIGPGFSFKKLLADFWFYHKASKVMKKGHIDVIHAGEESVFMALWFKMRYKTPYVYDLDSSIAQQMVEKYTWLRPFSFFFNWCEGVAIRNAIATAPVCNALADLAKSRGAKHFTTLHDISQLDEKDFSNSNDSIRTKLGIKENEVILMYVGNFETYQGVDLLLESIPHVQKQNDSIQLVIAGGSEKHIRQYKERAQALGIAEKTHFIGPWPAHDLAKLIGQADILTAPRIKGLNTPMKVFPYLHSGRAVVVTDLPTHTQILDKSICELAPPDPIGFANSIVRLAEDESLREKLGKAGREFVEKNHNFQAHQDRVNKLYHYVESGLKTTPNKQIDAKGSTQNV